MTSKTINIDDGQQLEAERQRNERNEDIEGAIRQIVDIISTKRRWENTLEEALGDLENKKYDEFHTKIKSSAKDLAKDARLLRQAAQLSELIK